MNVETYELHEWLVSFIENCACPLDILSLTQFHQHFSGENGFTKKDFYKINTNKENKRIEDIDLLLIDRIRLNFNKFLPVENMSNKNPQYLNNQNSDSDSDSDCELVSEEEYESETSSEYGENNLSIGFQSNKSSDTENFVDLLLNENNIPKFLKRKYFNCLERYGGSNGENIFIPPGIILSHVNLLFKMIISLIIQKDMKISLPQINNSSGKALISYNLSPIMTSNDKVTFYKFCYKYTTKRQTLIRSNTIKSFRVIPPPIITKELYGRSQLNNSIKINRENKQKKEILDNNLPYQSLSYDDTKKLINHIEEQQYKYYQFILDIWDRVFKIYLSRDNFDKYILDKLCNISGCADESVVQKRFNYSEDDEVDEVDEVDGVNNKICFRESKLKGILLDFFEDLDNFKTIQKIKNKLKITLEKHQNEHKQKEQELIKSKMVSSKSNNGQFYIKPNKNKLVSNFD